ncbi:hypothetical protein ILYODFUR_030212 [Ilyodon furcidens]|uniref:Uncharacterized protein n=1 Tax=Ilyodon furcidens TaxID=33524 RepID=A0ABV0T1K3_9TELE
MTNVIDFATVCPDFPTDLLKIPKTDGPVLINGVIEENDSELIILASKANVAGWLLVHYVFSSLAGRVMNFVLNERKMFEGVSCSESITPVVKLVWISLLLTFCMRVGRGGGGWWVFLFCL